MKYTLSLALFLAACGTSTPEAPPVVVEPVVEAPVEVPATPVAVPNAQPSDWDAVAFNTEAAKGGAVPKEYLEKVTGVDGATAHVGKHLAFVVPATGFEIPSGRLALMFGDAAAGDAQHPNAPAGTAGMENGHFFDTIRVRKSTDEQAEEAVTTFGGWPEVGEGSTGLYAAMGGGDIKENDGKTTVYLVNIPADVKSGEMVRVVGHCRYHGEYVQFVSVP